LAQARHGEALRARGVLYAPDYAINAGGIIDVCAERLGEDAAGVRARVERIGATLTAIFEQAESEGLPTQLVADRLAERRLYG
ncbi:MAG TPA: amino acid dehydrogenase, partial [Plasticicumulans sp.]|nr:amino acid dehydrogenase [Plasticicumulans sp.]